jgi:hypothetical protein
VLLPFDLSSPYITAVKTLGFSFWYSAIYLHAVQARRGELLPVIGPNVQMLHLLIETLHWFAGGQAGSGRVADSRSGLFFTNVRKGPRVLDAPSDRALFEVGRYE